MTAAPTARHATARSQPQPVAMVARAVGDLDALVAISQLTVSEVATR
jgi:hypothetical protein